MSTQRVRFLIAPVRLFGVALALAACGMETPVAAARTVAVQPRVIVDGTVELNAMIKDAAGLRIVVDEVLFHASAVTVQQDEAVLDELLGADESPLLFRYDASSSDGFGDVLGGERRWTVNDIDGDLVVALAPFSARLPVMTELERETGVPLGALRGHTATVHGFLLMAAPEASDADESDGVPAVGFAGDSAADENDGDPDGNPSEGDPDGNPAKGDAKSDESEGDPDGNPADRDSDGNPSHDPKSAGERAGQGVTRAANGPVRLADERVAVTRVPFTLVLNRAFSLRAPVADLFQTRLADDEVRPLDLHVRLDELLSQQMLALLDAQATDETTDAIVVEISNADIGLDVDGKGVERRMRAGVTSDGIRVVGGH